MANFTIIRVKLHDIYKKIYGIMSLIWFGGSFVENHIMEPYHLKAVFQLMAGGCAIVFVLTFVRGKICFPC
ncbi:MAG: hypothetical protein A2469_01260 [Candidatus Magasanikbacteria bacterium RIFOXYC2_FULL_40_16]|uniref:Uncharacterized protein n=3 Tax=Candidatus Magasanikiibacteriota TaxID=1752731 RepID=A0A1F6NG39_9BACT|nr:MAG: hypothetical protein A2224_01350 [Candidatus Magasanikbacteria bacterium RIFOXYA2_FULL_40_20]OGH82748.1 MAG: hypothetical protein A2373_03850 [Candidatus Magasanikbacteria bacterium RIFOXYB1_FULL_40_15]OGH87276.1 MAG: hypothetical protein A2206_01615 [Candidatus Magasanikbacteria bacterium RIFOXYA1_FULL_40_8]OGH90389.1 MAG: hypothetical protein A2469_01260 [Candidatus Magasanikbacteria bacterium RIFOXYC2_FULL_40_16]